MCSLFIIIIISRYCVIFCEILFRNFNFFSFFNVLFHLGDGIHRANQLRVAFCASTGTNRFKQELDFVEFMSSKSEAVKTEL